VSSGKTKEMGVARKIVDFCNEDAAIRFLSDMSSYENADRIHLTDEKHLSSR
jgi:hypothetical protein